jgi:hypothetical protein
MTQFLVIDFSPSESVNFFTFGIISVGFHEIYFFTFGIISVSFLPSESSRWDFMR